MLGRKGLSLSFSQGHFSCSVSQILSFLTSSSQQCKSGINPSFQCLDSYQLYIPPSLSSCPTSQTSCNVESQTEQPLEECSGYECVVCYSANPSDPCVVVDGVSTEEDCLQLVGCEMPDGTVRFFFFSYFLQETKTYPC